MHFGFVCYNQVMTKQHGGWRPGSGRKTVDPQEETVRVTIRLPKSYVEWLQTKSSNISVYIREILGKEKSHDDQNLHS